MKSQGVNISGFLSQKVSVATSYLRHCFRGVAVTARKLWAQLLPMDTKSFLCHKILLKNTHTLLSKLFKTVKTILSSQAVRSQAGGLSATGLITLTWMTSKLPLWSCRAHDFLSQGGSQARESKIRRRYVSVPEKRKGSRKG